jgi:hypothetical protein
VEEWKIEARSLNVLGFGSHDFWVLRAPDGRIVAELHGLATDRTTGVPVPVGTTSNHSLRAWLLPLDVDVATRYGVGQASRLLKNVLNNAHDTRS